MKKIIFLFTLLIFSLKAFSQDSGFVVGAYLNPTYSFRSIKTLSPNGASLLKRADSADKASGKIDFGIRLALNMSKHWKATVGLAYVSKGYTSSFSLDTPGTAGAKHTYTSQTYYNRFTFVEIPVYLTYKMGDSNFTFGIMGGVSFGFLSNYVRDTVAYDYTLHTLARTAATGADISNNIYPNGTYINLLLGLEFNFKISDHVSLFAEPNFRYSLSNFYPSPGYGDLLDARLWNVGCSLGVDYRF